MSYLSRREEELIETKRNQALALQILEVFTTQSTQDLRRLELLSSVWQSVDRNILRTLDDAQGREGTAKLLCELIVWKALEYWLMEDGMPCGQTDAEILAEFKAKVAAAAEAAVEPLADSPEPEPKQPQPVADKAKIEAGNLGHYLRQATGPSRPLAGAPKPTATALSCEADSHCRLFQRVTLVRLRFVKKTRPAPTVGACLPE